MPEQVFSPLNHPVILFVESDHFPFKRRNIGFPVAKKLAIEIDVDAQLVRQRVLGTIELGLFSSSTTLCRWISRRCLAFSILRSVLTISRSRSSSISSLLGYRSRNAYASRRPSRISFLQSRSFFSLASRSLRCSSVSGGRWHSCARLGLASHISPTHPSGGELPKRNFPLEPLFHSDQHQRGSGVKKLDDRTEPESSHSQEPRSMAGTRPERT